MRPDDSNTSSQGSNSMRRLDSAGTGWTFFSAQNFGDTGSTEQSCIGIKSGALKLGGEGSKVFKSALGLAVDDTWETIKASGVTSATINPSDASPELIIWS